ncbi:phospholipid phosphatase 1-like isoform X2 [Pectinophora gossypiella]|uniref:phospholipid phosphatase 1-like isoform X2 n=1 Tax=Pectinophora gossypiella TaxID=13191 RepID=UPI00214E26A0|nr:phospholipid phosphatase 1-like isoform X2 [Pectinophora gossypiella]
MVHQVSVIRTSVEDGIRRLSSVRIRGNERRDLESQMSKSNSGTGSHSVWWTLAIDIPLLVLVGLLVGLFELRILPGHKTGFFCNDPRLSYPFTGDTVSMAAIVSTVVLLPIPIIFVTELIFHDTDYFERTKIVQSIRNTLWIYRSYAYGLFLNLSVVEVMKLVTGAPRPTFFDICQPDTARTCNGSEFVPTFECTRNARFSSWFQSDSYHSFPSGHTSLSVHCGLFLAWYLQRRAFDWNHRCVFVVPVLQLALLSYSAVCSLTRVTDYRHHWWDVLVGTVIGVVSMLYAVLVLCKNFSYTAKTNKVSEGHQNALMYHNTRSDMVS